MSGRLIVVSGTDTGIGKTHLSTLLLRCARSLGRSAVGYKPIESGVDGAITTDAERLAAASDPAWLFHVKRAPSLQLVEPLSPHLAAERQGVALPWKDVTGWVASSREQTNLLVELPGGLFTPLAEAFLNVHAIRDLHPDVVVLAAPDRLGVLNHTLAAVEASRTHARIDVVALMAVKTPDSSSNTNAAELMRFTDVRVMGPWGWGADDDRLSLTVELASLWLGPA